MRSGALIFATAPAGGWGSIERHRTAQLGDAGGQHVDDATAPARPHHDDLAVAFGALPQIKNNGTCTFSGASYTQGARPCTVAGAFTTSERVGVIEIS